MFLDKALSVFSDDIDADQVMHKRDDEAAYQTLKQRHTDVFAMFPGELDRSDIEPWILRFEGKDDERALFMGRYRTFYKALEQLLPDPRALGYLKDFAWLRRLRREMVTHFAVEDTALPECSERVQELIDRHVKGNEIQVLLEPIPIMSERFADEVKKLNSPRAKASRMEHAISHTITVKLNEDPVFYESMKERLERIVADVKDRRIDDAEEFKLLWTLRDDLQVGQHQNAERLGIKDEVLPFYGVLAKHAEADGDTAAVEEGKLADLAESVFDALSQDAVLDWTSKEDVKREMRRKVKRQLRLADCSNVDSLTESIMSLAEVRIRP